MAEYNSDEERLTAIMDFLKRNQRTILLTFGAVFFTAITSVSVNSYYSSQNAQAAELYDAWFIDTLEETNDLEKKASTFNALQENFPTTGYAGLARLIKGSQEAREGNLEAGLEEFNALLDATSGLFGNDVLNVIARMNIARIELSNNNFLNALEALEPLNSSSEHPMVYEVKADALTGLNKNELALAQYNLAITNIQDESQKSLLKIKINKLTQ
ncbi:tetratricopeptide repeat protein [Gammaproteobacteria bacterium]|nr:tetratricopeptide repeat protein [Gammaproteobacteria bacterium]MDB9907411.1 tetratricopeptide repeat protein [Gammaproteobacteria bacterium]MDC0091134.1 tetratricopeptide repeat protein [Gammaproteobacteria bacterium]